MISVSRYARSIINSYGEIFFLKGYLPGILLGIISFFNPNIGLCGLICVISAYLFALFIGFHREFLESGFYTYNPLLVGLSIGYLFKIQPVTIFFIASSGVLTFVLTYSLATIFSSYLALPVLSLPFVIISSLVYLAASKYTNLFVTGLYPHFWLKMWEARVPLWLLGLTRSCGAIFFQPYFVAGVFLLLVLFLFSRILFLLALVGYFSGTLTLALFTGSMAQAFTSYTNFNFILIAMAIGGVFLIPSLKSYSLSIIATISSTILLEAVKSFWMSYSLPVFTLPFNVVTLSFIYVLSIMGYPLITRYYRGTPEDTLDYHLTYLARFPGTSRGIRLPFSGRWMVWQGMNGEWTHKGSWKYALDFVMVDEAGSTYKGEGRVLEDYYCYRKPVLSPVKGRVVKVINDVKDNPPGEVDREKNWGNLVVIYDERGFYVVVCHFLEASLEVKEGEWVEKGTLLGLCGNSGYSPQPHIHLHVQLSPELGAPTIPFSIVQYMDESFTYFSNHVPEVGQILTPLVVDKSLDYRTNFLLDEEMKFVCEINGIKKREITFKTKMAPSGEFYLDGEGGKIYFGKWEGTFYLYRLEGRYGEFHRAFFLSLPRMPLCYYSHLTWEDFLPLSLSIKGIKKHFMMFIASFFPSVGRICGRYTFLSPSIIEGKVGRGRKDILTTISLDPIKGIAQIELKEGTKNIIMRRC